MAEYSVWLTTDEGKRIALLDNVLWLSWTLTVNGPGACSVGLPVDFYADWLRPDWMFQFWRRPEGRRQSLLRTFRIRRWRYETMGSTELLTAYGADANELLKTRCVPYVAGSAQASKTDYADDMMKEIVDEAMVSDASSPDYGSRDLARLSIAPAVSAGPTLTQSFAWKSKVLQVLQDIAEASATAGTRLYFDIEENVISATRGITYLFKTYTGQPGQDLTGHGAAFDQERGTFEAAFLEYDYTDEENYVYGLGQGEGADREVQQVYDAARINRSIWGRREGTVNASATKPADGVREAARARLEQSRPIRKVGGSVVDLPWFAFGKDWGLGDLVRAKYRGIEFDAVVEIVQGALNGEGEETITARLEGVG